MPSSPFFWENQSFRGAPAAYLPLTYNRAQSRHVYSKENHESSYVHHVGSRLQANAQ